MLTQENYFIAWACYLVACIGLLFVWWHVTSKLKQHWLSEGLRVIAAALLITPAKTDPEQAYLAPAALVTLLEGIFEGSEAMLRTGVPLLVALSLALVVLFVSLLLQSRKFAERERTVREEVERKKLLQESRLLDLASDSSGSQ